MNQDLKKHIVEILMNDSTTNPESTIKALKSVIYQKEEESFDGNTLSLSNLARQNIQLTLQSHESFFPLKTGFREFDNEYGGFSFGDIIIVGGRPATGKTQFLINIALHISTTHPVLFLNFDMSEMILTFRFISTLTGVPTNRILESKLTELDRESLNNAESKLSKLNIRINANSNTSLASLRKICEVNCESKVGAVVIIDHLQSLVIPGFRYNRDQEMSYIMRELKSIALEYNICFLISSQLNRAVESRHGINRPALSDLRGSGTIEQEADKVFLLNAKLDSYEDRYNPTNTLEWIIAKNKNGKTGTLNLYTTHDFTSLGEGQHEYFSIPEERLAVQQVSFNPDIDESEEEFPF